MTKNSPSWCYQHEQDLFDCEYKHKLPATSDFSDVLYRATTAEAELERLKAEYAAAIERGMLATAELQGKLAEAHAKVSVACDLLAVMHRDGGHHTAKAYEELRAEYAAAIDLAERYQRLDETRAEVERLNGEGERRRSWAEWGATRVGDDRASSQLTVDAEHTLLKQETMPDGTVKMLLRHKASGRIVERRREWSGSRSTGLLEDEGAGLNGEGEK